MCCVCVCVVAMCVGGTCVMCVCAHAYLMGIKGMTKAQMSVSPMASTTHESVINEGRQ